MRECVFNTLMAEVAIVNRCEEVKAAVERTEGLSMKVLSQLIEKLEPAAGGGK
jgi:hypothetical protein